MPAFPTLSLRTGYFDPRAARGAGLDPCLGTEATRLKFLTDYIDIGYSVLSIGDLFIRAFVVLIVFYAVKSHAAGGRVKTGHKRDRAVA